MSNEQQLLLTVDEAAQRLRIGRSHLYTLVACGEIPSVKLGRSRRIPVVELEGFVTRRTAEAVAGSGPVQWDR